MIVKHKLPLLLNFLSFEEEIIKACLINSEKHQRREDNVKNVICFTGLLCVSLLMEAYENESDAFLSVLLSPCSMLLPGCSSPASDGCWIRLTCSVQNRGYKPFCLAWWSLDLGGSSVRDKRSLVDELLQALTLGPAEPSGALNEPLIACGQWYCGKCERLERCDLPGGGQTFCYWNSEGLRMGHATPLSGETQHRAGCLNSIWLALLCQPLQLFVPFW